MDVSNSMEGEKFEEAKAAANAFLDKVPDDVYVGLVTFADDVDGRRRSRPRTPTRCARSSTRSSSRRETRLYDGVLERRRGQPARRAPAASSCSPTAGTPPRPRSTTSTAAVEESGVKVDVVALAQSDDDEALLEQLADAGDGQVLSADDPDALAASSSPRRPQLLAQQVLVTVTPPAELAGEEGTLAVTLAGRRRAGRPTRPSSRSPTATTQVGGGELGADLAGRSSRGS